MTFSSSFYKFVIVLLLAGIAFFWFKNCHPSTPTPAITENKIATDSVAKLKALIDTANMQIGFLREDSILQEKVIDDKDAQLSLTQAKLDKANKQATNLANDVVTAREKNDTAGYETACDSLAYVTKRDQFIKDSLRKATAAALDARNGANKIANQAKSDLQKQAVAYSGALSLLQKTNANLAAALVPTNKVYIGLDAIGSSGPSSLLGAGGELMLITKTEKAYGVGVGLFSNGQPWLMVRGAIKISLHK